MIEEEATSEFIPELMCRWIELVEGVAKPPDKEAVASSSLGTEFAIMYWEDPPEEDEQNGLGPNVWTARILKKVQKSRWEILDISGIELIEECVDVVDAWDEESIYRIPTDAEIERVFLSFERNQGKKITDDNLALKVSPRRKVLHAMGYHTQLRQAKKMKSNAHKADGNILLGDVVQVPLHTSRDYHASVQLRGDMVIVQSSAKAYVPPVHKRSFLECLRALPNQSLWDNLVIDGDGTWIYEGLLRNSLTMMSDGSYDEKEADDICSCAAMIRCTLTNKCASVTWVEKSDRYSADNYRAEILGPIALQLLVQTACDGKYISPSMRPRFGCDNKGVVYHGNHPWHPITSTQMQADLLRYYKELVRSSPFKCSMYHVHGHLDELLSYDQMSPAEKLNCECDKLADLALCQSLESHQFIHWVFPHEDLVVLLDDGKISGAYDKTITRNWGDKQARHHYDLKGIIPAHLFDEIYWDGTERVLNQCPEMFAVWASKHVSGFNGNNHLQRHIMGTTADICPNCGITPERSTHIIYCRDPARTAVFDSSVDKLVEWCAVQRTDPELTNLLSSYLRSRGEESMASLCSRHSRYAQLAEMIDELGFRNMMEGRIPRLFYSTRVADIKRRRLRKHAGHWCNGLILQLLQITHRQWTFRNGTLHLKGPDRLTSSQWDKLAQKCEDLLWTDPTSLLEEDRYLLDIDFMALGDAPAATRQVWMAEMDSARCAARIDEACISNDTFGVEDIVTPIDTEGSIRFRRRRRRSTG